MCIRDRSQRARVLSIALELVRKAGPRAPSCTRRSLFTASPLKFEKLRFSFNLFFIIHFGRGEATHAIFHFSKNLPKLLTRPDHVTL